MLVLIADEDASARDVARRSVERFGYRCAAVSDGAEAWDRIVADSPDVVLASVALSSLNGPELYRRVRERRASPQCYLIAIVAEADGEGIFAGWRAVPTISW